MSKQNLSLGVSGEEAAACFLKNNGYKILARNYKTKLGEIDIVAKEKDTFCFVEVKTRSSLGFGHPAEAVSRLKQRQITKAALIFLKEKRLLDKKARFDVVSIVCAPDDPQPVIELMKDAFELDGDFTC